MADEDSCDNCGNTRWLHMEEPFEIQACAECTSENGVVDDQAAIRKHKLDHPNCQWPDHDIQNAFLRQIFYAKIEKVPDEIVLKLDVILEAAGNRLGFPASFQSLLLKLGEVVDRLEQLEGTKVAWTHLEHAIAYVVQSIYRMKAGRWTLAHALGPDDGTYAEDGQWKVRPLEKDRG